MPETTAAYISLELSAIRLRRPKTVSLGRIVTEQDGIKWRGMF